MKTMTETIRPKLEDIAADLEASEKKYVRGGELAKMLDLSDMTIWRYAAQWEKARDAGIPADERPGIPVAFKVGEQRVYSLRAVLKALKYDPDAD